MRWPSKILASIVFANAALFSLDAAATCTVPNTLTNGTTADATQVMADFNALISCLAGLPAGSTNAVQYNAGSGAMGAVGPLTDGQLVIGSTGAAPQAAAITPGTGITIVNGPGSITISSSGGGGSSWTVVTSNITASPGGMYLVDTSGGPITITLPTSGVVEIADAKGTFGTNNVTVQAAGGQTLSGITYSGVSSIDLNAPGNNAIINCGSSIAYVQQTASGVWGFATGAGVASIQFTGLPPFMNFDFELDNFSTSASALPVVQTGYGATPSWVTSGYYGTELDSNGVTGWANDSYFYIFYRVNTLWSQQPVYVTLRGGNAGSSNGNLVASTDWFSGSHTVGGSSNGAVTAIQFFATSGTISTDITVRWSKTNV